MTVAAPPALTGPVTGEQLTAWMQSVSQRLSQLEQPGSPTPLYACTKKLLPAASSFVNCAALITDLGVVVTSNGAHWVNAGTGAVIA